MYEITFWEDPKIKRDPSDYDEIETIKIKSVDEIRTLIWNRPRKCTFITLERTGQMHSPGRGRPKTDKYKIRPLWEKNNPVVQGYRKYVREL